MRSPTQLEDVRNRPQFRVQDAAQLAREHYGLDASAQPLPGERDQNFQLTCDSGESYILKIANTAARRDVVAMQGAAMRHLADRPGADRPDAVAFPRPRGSLSGQEIVEIAGADGRAHLMRLVTYLPGIPLADARPHGPALLTDLGRALGAMTRALAGFSHPAAARELRWDLARADAVIQHRLPCITDPERRALVDRLLAHYRANVAHKLTGLRTSAIHNDGNDHNVLVELDPPRITGIIDFGDMVQSRTIHELAVCLAYVMLDSPAPIAAAARVVAGYHAEFFLDPAELDVVFDLARMRLCMSVAIAAEQTALAPDNDYLAISEIPAWNALARLSDVDPALAQHSFRAACGLTSAARPADVRDIRALRSRHIGTALSLSYREPLTIVRGWMQYLYDDAGQEYLDCVNNVCHVGHCHPTVASAARSQIAALNTNTRYLHPDRVRYAQRLADTMPDPLDVCLFVCSGSEANDLALRMARTYTGRRDVIVVDGAYHGNLSSLIEISPYKFDGPGGAGAPGHVHKVVTPDVYRGPYKADDPLAGKTYASHVASAIERARRAGSEVAAFICESALGCAGQIVLPDGYLPETYRLVRNAGGVCIADEVQVGFGRVGSHMWGFETHGVIPDIVTLGKPIGNGHPMAAVITTREIADAFANGMEYFNTFGGNPVSCAIGLAVLDVLEHEALQARAAEVGGYLLTELTRLQDTHAAIGDVRGLGLFIGIELVSDRDTRAPAAELASHVVEEMKKRNILLSTDGPLHNVIKIKPPLKFSLKNANLLVETMSAVLADLTS